MTEPTPAQPSELTLPERMEALEQRAKEAEQRVTELLAEQAEAVAELVVRKLPKHWLHLANGQVVESEGAIPTHVSSEDGPPVPVVHAFDR